MLSGNISIGCLLRVSIRKRFLGLQVFVLLFAAAAQAAGPTLYGTPQTAANTTSGSTSLTISLPNGGTPVSASTIYIIQIADRASSPTFNVPSGFTQLCSISVGSLNEEQTFYEVFGANSTPPATVTLTLSGGFTWAGATAVAYQNINPSAPFDAGCQTVSQTTSSTTLAGPSITTTKPNEMVIWNFFVHGDIGTGAVTVSQGTTEAQVTRAALAGDGYLNYTDKPQPSAGASGTNTLTWGRGASISGAIAFALEAPAGYSPPPQDQYGGLLALPCTNTNTTFSVVTVGNRLVLCTPGQHEFNGRGPFTFDWSLFTTPDESGEGFSGYETTKYGTSSVYGTQEIANMKTWGWNMLGPYAGSTFQGYLFDIPYIAFGNIAYYARTNSGGYTTNCAVKELMYLLGQSGNITRWGGYSSSNGLTDFADPCWQTYHLAFLNNDPAFGVRSATTAQKGYLVAISDCDSDNCHGFNAGPDFTVKNGNNDYKIGYATLFMAPTLYANSQQSQVYSSGTVYQKKLMHDALVAKYGTIGALNTSWGSSYTTFDSSGVCVGAHIPITCSSTFPADSLGTGDGTTLTFSTTLSHVPTVDDFSVAVYVAGTLVGGETGTGNIYGTNLQASTVNKTTGAITVTFTGGHAPANGAALTVEYVQNGYRVGTGFMDEDCRSGHSSYCGSGSNSVTINLTGIPSNVQSDINAQGTAIANAYSSAGKASIASWATAHGFTGHILYCGPTLAGSWGGPPDKYVLAGYAGNVDCLMQGGSGQGFTHYTQAMNDYIQSQMGDIPQFETSYRTANADSEFAWNNLACTHSGSSVTCTINGTNNFSANAGKHHIDSTCSPSDYNASNVNFSAGANTVTYTAAGASSSSATCNVFYEDSNEGGFATQGARGNDLYSDVTSQINATYTATGTKFVIGYIHWGEQSNQSERLNWGVLTTRGNPLNGVDPTSTTQACSINTGFNCGGELSNHPVPYGDYIGPIGLANTALDNALLVP